MLAPLEVMALGYPKLLYRPCVGCGKKTGSFCDYCRAADRMLDELWADNQRTPLCTRCERREFACRYCRWGWYQPKARPQ